MQWQRGEEHLNSKPDNQSVNTGGGKYNMKYSCVVSARMDHEQTRLRNSVMYLFTLYFF